MLVLLLLSCFPVLIAVVMFSNVLVLFFSVTVPGTYDGSRSAYNSGSRTGVANIIVSYFLFDLSFYLDILIKLRTKVFTSNGEGSLFE